MPLLDLKTKLKDLKFNTLAPYVVKDINNPPVYNSLSNEVSSRADDVSRLTKMFLDRPGAIFLAKQAALQATDKTNYAQRGSNIAASIATALFRSTVSVGQTGLTILGQASVEGTGTRLVGKLPPFYYTKAFEAGGSQTVFGTEVTPRDGFKTIYSTRTSKFRFLAEEQKATFQTDKKLTETSEIEKDKQGIQSKNGGSPSTATANLALSGNTITISNYKSAITGKEEYPLDVVSGKGFAGAKRSDEVNLLDIGEGKETDDLVPLMFSKFASDGSHADLKLFRGFLGTISDSYQANWSGQKYVGRMEQFYIYTGFGRTLNFPFTVPIFSEDEQLPVYSKVNSLVSHTAPSYKDGLPSGIITYLKIGDYIETPGIVNSVSVSVDTNVPWSYSKTKPKEGKTEGMLLPQVLQLQIQFTPIHKFAPAYTSRKLSNSDGKKFFYIANAKEIKN